jgi:hypothetical protein
MKTIIAGSLSIISSDVLLDALQAAPWTVTAIVSDGARGAGRLGEKYASRHALPLDVIPADRKRFGRRAGYIRNVQMAEQADALIALWDGQSPDTMIDIARSKGLRVFVWKVA